MKEVSRTVVTAHRIIRPIAAVRQITPARIHELTTRAVEKGDTLSWIKIVGVRMAKPVAGQSYKHALHLASRLTGRDIIGAGLEVIVAHDGRADDELPVTKYATKVNGSAKSWSYELERRQALAEKRMGKFAVHTEYDLGHVSGQQEASMVLMYQPLLDIVDDDGHSAADMADQRGEFHELATGLAHDEGLYFDVIPGHGNLIVHEVEGVRQLAVADMVMMSSQDEIRPFVPYAPNPEEWTSWLDSVRR